MRAFLRSTEVAAAASKTPIWHHLTLEAACPLFSAGEAMAFGSEDEKRRLLLTTLRLSNVEECLYFALMAAYKTDCRASFM